MFKLNVSQSNNIIIYFLENEFYKIVILDIERSLKRKKKWPLQITIFKVLQRFPILQPS